MAGSAKLNGATISPDPVSSNSLSASIGTLAAGATATVTYHMTVSSSGAPGGVTTLNNTATVSDAGTAGSRSSNQVSVSITTNPNLTFTKTSTPSSGPVAAGSTIVFTLTVSNTGNSDASAVKVQDLIPANTSYTSGTLTYSGAARSDVQDGERALRPRPPPGCAPPAPGRRRVAQHDLLGGAGGVTPNGTTTIGGTATASASNASTRTAFSSTTRLRRRFSRSRKPPRRLRWRFR
jgi:uncharacterized repeat protein (TIGR01451 family)